MKYLLLAVGGLVGLVVRKEYDDWAPRCAKWMIGVAARFHPGDSERMGQEWLAELASIPADESEARGLLFSGFLLIRYVLPCSLLAGRSGQPWH